MAARLKLIIAYDGTPFSGWQSQANGDGIQDIIEAAFGRIAGTRLRIHGSGRTDAGVHALGQCAHVDVADRRLTPNEWRAALNSNLPQVVRVLRCSYVPCEFHARFSAVSKTYRYRVWNGEILPPLEHLRCWHIPRPLDFGVMHAAADLMVGRHDFAAFAASRGKAEGSTLRTMESAGWSKRGKLLTFEITGDGFLYKMVRLIAGAAVRVGTGKLSPESVAAMLAGRVRPQRFVAPASGLYLVRVRY